MNHKIMNCQHCGKILPKEFWHERSLADKPNVKYPDVVAQEIEKTQNDIRLLE